MRGKEGGKSPSFFMSIFTNPLNLCIIRGKVMSYQEQQIINLNNQLERASFLYHVLAKPEIEDEVYDSLYRQLVDLESKYPEFRVKGGITSRVGNTPLDFLQKVKHQKPLLSLKNVFNIEDIYKELPLPSTSNCPYIANAKLDGVALSLIYKEGKLDKAITRGDGETGEDVTEVARTILNIPKVLTYPVEYLEVRGETVIPKEAFKRLNEQMIKDRKKPYANTRNAVSGILRLLDPNEAADKPLAFFAYGIGDWVENDVEVKEGFRRVPKSLSAALTRLNRLGFSHKRFSTLCSNDSIEIKNWIKEIVEKWTELRNEYDVDIDGIVFGYDDLNLRALLGSTSTYPHYAMAYKFPAAKTVSKLVDVEWQVGRTGVITPVAHIEPVQLHGVTISRVTLHNLAEIRRLGIMLGDSVVVSRQGDVIPKIQSVLVTFRDNSQEEIKIPYECPTCSCMTVKDEEDTFLFCKNPNCSAQLITRLEHYASRDAMNIQGLGISIIRLLVDKGLLSMISDIYKLKEERKQLLNIEGFGETSVDKLLESIENSKTTDLYRFIYGLGIPGVGESTAKNICQHFKNDLGKIINPNQKFRDVPDVGHITASVLKIYFSDLFNIEQIGLITDQLTWIDYQDTAQIFSGQTWVVTGGFDLQARRKWEWILSQRGANITGSVSKNTDCILAGSGTENGSKLSKAKELNIRIVSERELADMIEEARTHRFETIKFF